MARRYASSFVLGSDFDTLGVNPLTSAGAPIVTTAAGGAVWTDQAQYVMAAPSCYSEVRKVIFWCVFRHEQSAGPSNFPCRVRVAPTSSSSATRTLETAEITPGTQYVPGSTIWSENSIANEACFYPSSSRHNTVSSLQFTTADIGGGQLVWQEFDRFEATDADFFSDWDQVAAGGNDDVFIGYHLAVERGDGSPWTNIGTGNINNRPVIVACGFAVVQAPATTNNTRILIPATQGGIFGAMSGVFSFTRCYPFFYRPAELDGDVELRYVSVIRNTGGNIGSYSIQVNAVENQSDNETEVFSQSFVLGSAAHVSTIARSDDLIPFISDGMGLMVRHRNDLAGNQPAPYGWWEITQKNFNRTTVSFHPGGGATVAANIPGGPPTGTVDYEKTECLFDPLWFQDMESYRFISTRIVGGLGHALDGNSARQQLTMNANLEESVVTSAFNSTLAPEISVTPQGQVGKKLRDGELTSSNPLNLAGKRKLTLAYRGIDWTGPPADEPGGLGLIYVIAVPNTDIVELGPLFDLGSFNAEGCAATSAGLGEPPVLVITNGSTIPKKFNPTAAGTDGEVEDAGIPVPFEGETPQTVVGDAAASPDGGLELGTYRYRYTFRNCCTGRESDPNPEDIVVDTTTASPAAQVTISFAGIRIPSDPQICEICLYRTLEGGDFPIMAKVGCFNINDTTIFVDDMSDDALDFLNDPLSILNAPMPCVPIVVDFRNRLFGMGDIPNLAMTGTVSVVNGSDLIEGSEDVLWDRCLEGKFIKVGADCKSYEILRVLPPEEGTSPAIQRLRLVDVYEGETDTGLSYEVCGRPNRLYFSEPLEPEYWPAANFLDVEPGDGDRLMGAVSNFDRLVICKRNKTYVLTFRENPGIEVFVPSRISSDIGCVGPRTFAQTESGSVWLADRGVAFYDGRTVQHVPESANMNDIFTDPDNPNYVRRDRNGRVIEAVGVFNPSREQYLLLLPTVNTNRGCNMMLVWDVKLQNITLLKFCQEFLSMVVAKDAAGNQRVYLGDTNGFVWIFDIGDCDGVGFPNATGTVRGTVTFAGVDPSTGASVLDDDSATFIEGGIPGLADLSGIAGLSGSFGGGEMGLAGVCVYTRRVGAAYDDPWVQRVIYAATTHRLYVTPQWGPDTPFDATGQVTYEYMIGAIELDLLFKPQNYGTDDISKRDWRQIVVHETEQFASKLRVDLLPDFSMADPEADTVVDPVTEDVGEGRVFRMDYAKGRQIKPVGRNVHFYMAVRMRNFAPEEPIGIINHLLGVEVRASK